MRADILPHAPLLMPELLQKLGDNKTLVRQVQYAHFTCITSAKKSLLRPGLLLWGEKSWGTTRRFGGGGGLHPLYLLY
jgi:hypothetical protein